jgi:hypothetical protein
MNFYTSLGWTIRDRRCVELVKCFPFDYTYAFFGVWQEGKNKYITNSNLYCSGVQCQRALLIPCPLISPPTKPNAIVYGAAESLTHERKTREDRRMEERREGES